MQEEGYLALMEKVLEKGISKPTRTGVNCQTLFGEMLTFDLKNGFPLLTTKKMPYRWVVEELLWFLSGSTDANDLKKIGVNIWDANASEESIKKCGLSYRQGDIGPSYGFQWRHQGEKYKNCDSKYEGFDQISNLVENLRKDPYSRRHIINSYNPSQIKEMVLPPCHISCQFNVETNTDGNFLNCALFQRSIDLPLGAPFNIASYSTLVYMLAKVCSTFNFELKPGKFIYFMGDVHIYENQIKGCKEQIKRKPLPFPTVSISTKENIFDFQYKDFELKGYKFHPTIKFPFSV